jgi:hypothetical protein
MTKNKNIINQNNFKEEFKEEFFRRIFYNVFTEWTSRPNEFSTWSPEAIYRTNKDLFEHKKSMSMPTIIAANQVFFRDRYKPIIFVGGLTLTLLAIWYMVDKKKRN